MTIAQAMQLAGESLHRRLAGAILSRQMIKAEVLAIVGCAEGSVRPSDFCYNRVNKDPWSRRTPCFLEVARDQFLYVGPDHRYNGEILWKPDGKPERVVARVKDGHETWFHDPRSA